MKMVGSSATRHINCNLIPVPTISDKQLFKIAYEKVKKSILKNDEKSAKQIIAVLKKDQRHAIHYAPDEEDTLLYLYVKWIHLALRIQLIILIDFL